MQSDWLSTRNVSCRSVPESVALVKPEPGNTLKFTHCSALRADGGPAGRWHSGTEQTPASRHRPRHPWHSPAHHPGTQGFSGLAPIAHSRPHPTTRRSARWSEFPGNPFPNPSRSSTQTTVNGGVPPGTLRLPVDDEPAGQAPFLLLLSCAPSVGFEPTHTAPEADALSPELRGLAANYHSVGCWQSNS
jgi:hypothetical protein